MGREMREQAGDVEFNGGRLVGGGVWWGWGNSPLSSSTPCIGERIFFFKQIFSAKIVRAPQTHPVALSPFGGVGAWEWGVGGN